MKNYYKVLLVFVFVLALSSCSKSIDEQVVINNPTPQELEMDYYWNPSYYGSNEFYEEEILDFSNSSLSFELFYLVKSHSEDYYYFDDVTSYSYTFELVSSKQTNITFTCESDIYDMTINPDGTLTYIRSLPLSAFVDDCKYNDQVDVLITEEDEVVYHSSFQFEPNIDFNVNTLSVYESISYDYTNFLYIFIVGIVLLFTLIMGYRVYYNYRINKQLLNSNKKTFYLADIWIVFVLSTIVVVILIFSTIFISKNNYDEHNFEQVSASFLDYRYLMIDMDEYEIPQFTVYVNGDGEVSTLGEPNAEVTKEVFTSVSEDMRDSLDTIINELNTDFVTNVNSYNDYYIEEVENESVTFKVVDDDEIFLIHFTINNSGNVESIIVTNEDNQIFTAVDPYNLAVRCGLIMDEIETLISE